MATLLYVLSSRKSQSGSNQRFFLDFFCLTVQFSFQEVSVSLVLCVKIKPAIAIFAILMMISIIFSPIFLSSCRQKDASVSVSSNERVMEKSEKLSQLFSLLNERGGHPISSSQLVAWQEQLLKGDREETVQAILQVLQNGDDSNTGLEFALGEGNRLSSWSTWRVFLLDVLFLLDPEKAKEISKLVLENKSNPDEWALALRNVAALGRDEDREFIKQRMRDMLAEESWGKKPSSGYLHAFDIIVHTRDTSFFEDLLKRCANKDARAIRHASFMVLDRLSQLETSELLKILPILGKQHPDCGVMISQMMARGNALDINHRLAMEQYLLAPTRNDEEIKAFCGVFPNQNQMVSNNLLSPRILPSPTNTSEFDDAAILMVDEWLNNPNFSKIHLPLTQLRQRLRMIYLR